jgi:hypothetical protein
MATNFTSTVFPTTNDPLQIAKMGADLQNQIKSVIGSVNSLNQIVQPISSIPTANINYTFKTLNSLYTVYIPAIYLVAASGGPYTLTLAASGGTSTIVIPIIVAGSMPFYQDLLFNVYVTAKGVIAQENVRNLFANSVTNNGFFRYYTSDNVATQYIHMKTNVPINTNYNDMFGIHFLGYSYGETKTIDAMLGFYSNGGNLSALCTSGTHTCSAYKSADNFVVMTMSVTSTNFIGFTCDQISAGPQGLVTSIIVTASTHTGSSTGAY